MNINIYWKMFGDWVLNNGIQIILTLILTFISLKIINFIIEKSFTNLIFTKNKINEELEKKL